MDYNFRDLATTVDDVQDNQQLEGFKFANFDSAQSGWWLLSRDAPTPEEKEVTESVPYSQGKLDFSVIGSDRFFENREITYQLLYLDDDYQERKVLESGIKQQLMPQLRQSLYDSHEDSYHWLAKAKSVTVEDDAEYGTLKATIVFDAYPFAIGNDDGSDNDVWDEVYFPDWIFQDYDFAVNNETVQAEFVNSGDHTIVPEFIVTGTVTIGGVTLTAGTYQNAPITLAVGANKLSISGKGTVKLRFFKEVMI